jgi:hypothetical protein
VQADAARSQATAAADRARAGADQASAAADQARIARQVFEASHRPYLEASVDARTHSAGAGRADVETFKNC